MTNLDNGQTSQLGQLLQNSCKKVVPRLDIIWFEGDEFKASESLFGQAECLIQQLCKHIKSKVKTFRFIPCVNYAVFGLPKGTDVGSMD